MINFSTVKENFTHYESFATFAFSEEVEKQLKIVFKLLDSKGVHISQASQKNFTRLCLNSQEKSLYFTFDDGKILFLQKLDERKKLSSDTFRRASSVLQKKFQSMKIKSVLLLPIELNDSEIKEHFESHEYYIESILEGLMLGDYKYDEYLSKKEENSLDVFLYYNKLKEKEIKRIYLKTEKLMKYVYLARNLQNKPSNELTPFVLSEFVKENSRKFKKLNVRIFGFEEIKKMKMGGLIAVGKGSQNPPYFIVMEYKGNPSSKEKYVLVGKGITFDSGGISLKPAQGMWEMKGDMSGAATVISTIFAAADFELKVNLIGLIPTAENMPSSKSMKPGDIIRTASGKSIEIDNTDAEGRLILADALEYAAKFIPKFVIDLATLTGACVVALGQFAAGLFTRSENLAQVIESSSKVTGERVWRLPLWDDYHNLIKSDYADVKNVGGRWAGAITAACFLEKFVNDQYEWAHLDIAGPAFAEDTIPYNSKTMTGYGVRLLFKIFSDMIK